jgi:hypothetical protein
MAVAGLQPADTLIVEHVCRYAVHGNHSCVTRCHNRLHVLRGGGGHVAECSGQTLGPIAGGKLPPTPRISKMSVPRLQIQLH